MEAVRLEDLAEPADGLQVVGGGLGRGQDAVGKPEQSGAAEQVVQRGQRGQVLLDGGGPVQHRPGGAFGLDGAHHDPG